MALYKTLALVGGTATAVGCGVLVSQSSLFKNNPIPITARKKETFRQKYIHAILSEEDGLWDTKFSAFTNGRQPNHGKLSEAKANHSSNASEAKSLHKQGCQEIYNSELEGSSYLEDFQAYCAKTIKDGMAQGNSWIDWNPETTDAKWNGRLDSLKNHNATQNGTLDNKLSDLKNKLTPTSDVGSSSNWDSEKREELKNWCEETKLLIFQGQDDNQFKHAKLYCVEVQAGSSGP